MRIATQNTNSTRTQHERALAALEHQDLDVLLLQETKCHSDQFPIAEFEATGCEVAAHGLDQWNSVTAPPHMGVEEMAVGFENQPASGKEGTESKVKARMIDTRCGGVDVWNLHMPNGRALDDPHYPCELEFLVVLRQVTGAQLTEDSSARPLLAEDWSIVPNDVDVWNLELFRDEFYANDPEREAFHTFADAGFAEVARGATEAPYTFRDYQHLCFSRNEDM